MRGGFRPRVLVEAGQRRLIAAGDADQAIAEDAFAVGDMADQLLHGPFAVGVTVIAPVLRQRPQPIELSNLILEQLRWSAIGHLGDVAGIEGGEFGRIGTGNDHDDSAFSAVRISASCSSVFTPWTSEGSC